MQKNFLILNGLVVTLVVLSFLLLRRAPKAPVKLELRDQDEIAAAQARDAKDVPPKPRPKFVDPRIKGGKMPSGWADYQPRNRKVYAGATEADTAPGRKPQGPGAQQVKSLNVLFNWNGHTWDAYEVLGVPAGSSLESARSAFERAVALADTETVPFLKAAFDAIARGSLAFQLTRHPHRNLAGKTGECYSK